MNYGSIDIALLVQIAHLAGDAIMEIYNTEFSVESKDDESPLTLADKRANDVIQSKLFEHYPDIPYLSEEGKSIAYDVRKSWTKFWLIDPLDGTKEFVKKNGEFTVNISLIEDGQPVLGIVFAPALKKTYVGVNGFGAFRFENNTFIPIGQNNIHHSQKSELTIVASRSHLSDETKDYIDIVSKDKQIEFVSSGSSLKFCLVAEGAADIYPRLAPTMEWDTAAAQAVAENAGRKVINLNTGMSLTYNKPNLLNPYFVVE
jgi:3'(2'), 5'-bisphosphate nucleotidase